MLSRFRGVLVGAALLLVAAVGVLWALRVPVLTALGRLVVEERAPSPSDAIVVLSSSIVLGAAEAAELYRAGHAPRVVVLEPLPGADERILAQLEVGIPSVRERALLVLTRLGVPRDAVIVEGVGDGTDSRVLALVRWAHATRARQVIVVGDRSHSRRIATMLRRKLGDRTVIVMRASRHDAFDPEAWWRQRGMARELVMEGLRWANSLVLGDLWSRAEAPALTRRTAALRRWPRCRSAATPCG
jgi:uncharacterized SAM-binding protein YcdF (DUF218 family)